MKKSHINIIIIFLCFCFLLTGCTKKEENNEKLKDIEQVNILEIKLLTLYEKISGIQITRQIVAIKNVQSKKQTDNLSANQNDSQLNQDNKIENSIETTQITYDNNILKKEYEANWNVANELCYEIENIVLDIESELFEKNDYECREKIDQNMDMLINAIVKKDKEESDIAIANLYECLLEFIKDVIQDERIYNIKNLYYNCIKSLIYLENDDIENYKLCINNIKSETDDILYLSHDKNVKYIVEKIKMLIDSIDENYENDGKENIRMKLIILTKSISSIDTYIQKIDKYNNI